MANEARDPMTEGIWLRAARDTKRRWGVSVLVALALGFTENVVAPDLLPENPGFGDRALNFAIVVIAVLTALFLYNVIRAPFRQRDEGREEVMHQKMIISNRDADIRDLRRRELSIQVQSVDATPYANLGDDGWRASLLITNIGNDPESVQAFLKKGSLEGMRSPPSYGGFPLQWETGPEMKADLSPSQTLELHVFGSKNRVIRFLSPGSYSGGAGRSMMHSVEIKVPDTGKGVLAFYGMKGNAEVPFELRFLAEGHKPVLVPKSVRQA